MQKKIVNNYGSFDVVMKYGKKATLTDIAGKDYIDFVAGIGVNCLGYAHKKLVEAICSQAKKQIHISNYYLSDIGLKFADELLNATGFEGGYFGNSGAEANECAVKLARKYGHLHGGSKRHTIVTLEKSFHGRTITTLKATGQDRFHPDCFAPYPEGFSYIKAGDYNVLDTCFNDTTAAFMLECVQGEGGVNLIDKEWALKAVASARAAGAIVIADEVQTGMGRTGNLLASEFLGIEPEVVTLAKGIAGGVPMGACLFRGRANNIFVAGDHQSTFAGNPLACSAGSVVINELTAPGFLEKVREKGEYIRNSIKNWNLPCVKQIRGRGLMIGVDVTQKSALVQKACLNRGLLITTAGENILRFLPPLIISYKEIDKGLEILNYALTLDCID